MNETPPVSGIEAGLVRRAFADSVVALRAMEKVKGTKHLVDFDLVQQLLEQVQAAFNATEVEDMVKLRAPEPVVGRREPVCATIQPCGRGWTIVCSACGARPPYPKERISALVIWHEWHAHLRGCLVTTQRKHKPRWPFPSEYRDLTRAS